MLLEGDEQEVVVQLYANLSREKTQCHSTTDSYSCLQKAFNVKIVTGKAEVNSLRVGPHK